MLSVLAGSSRRHLELSYMVWVCSDWFWALSSTKLRSDGAAGEQGTTAEDYYDETPRI